MDIYTKVLNSCFSISSFFKSTAITFSGLKIESNSDPLLSLSISCMTNTVIDMNTWDTSSTKNIDPQYVYHLLHGNV